MISDRPYRPALPPKAAVDEVRAGSGTQFDPRAANALLDVLAHSGAPRRAPFPQRTGEPTS
jgi:HD-GYP domain-containing protein (c-di-GMP phosphodiesterase class II)